MAGKIRTLTALAIVTVLLGITGISAAPADATPPDPQQLPPTGIPWKDQIYYGAVPEGSESLPVLVFVHGLGGLAQDWWDQTPLGKTNDMYITTYNYGYRTAFVNLNANGQRWPLKSMWLNGRVLAKQIGAIADYYGVEKVDVVAHSKGAID